MKLTQALLSRYFRRYIERELTHENLRRQWNPISGWKEVVKKSWNFGKDRPWTTGFKQDNPAATRPKRIFVEPIKEWHVFKGDRVQILVGRDKGKQGLINCIIKERNWVYVEGLNCKFTTRSNTPGVMPTCVKDEMPLIVTTQIKLVDPADNEPTDVEWRYTEQGEHVRVSVRSGRIIPVPSGANELDDFVNPILYEETEKDTKEKELTEVTFVPKLCFFEDEIMKVMGIEEKRKWAKYYYY